MNYGIFLLSVGNAGFVSSTVCRFRVSCFTTSGSGFSVPELQGRMAAKCS